MNQSSLFVLYVFDSLKRIDSWEAFVYEPDNIMFVVGVLLWSTAL